MRRQPKDGAVAVQRPRIGELLVATGVLDGPRLEQALSDPERQRRGERLGRAVVRLGLADEEAVADAVARQMRLDRVDVARAHIDAAALASVPAPLAERHDVLPLALAGDTLRLATSDPSDTAALDDVRWVSGARTVIPVVATPSALTVARRRWYAAEASQQLLGEAATSQLTSTQGDERGVDLVTGSADDPIVELVDALLTDAVASGASDLHLEPDAAGLRVRLRIDGLLRDRGRVPRERAAAVRSRLKVVCQLDIAERRRPQDGRARARVGDRSVDLRISTMPTVLGEAVLLRLLPTDTAGRPIDDVGLSDEARTGLVTALSRPQGLVLMTGPTGSGKTTTLYAGLRATTDSARKVLTLEDPVEYLLPGIQQTQIHPEVGLTFDTGLRHLLRHDPDVVLVGEIRDPETARLAVEAAFTGHLVLATLHTNDAPSAITRLASLGIEPPMVAQATSLVIAQRLVRLLCPRCAQPGTPDPDVLTELGVAGDPAQTGRHAPGCVACDDTGAAGRTAITEALRVDHVVAERITEGEHAAALARTAHQQGMRTLRAHALERAAAGEIAYSEALRVTPDPHPGPVVDAPASRR